MSTQILLKHQTLIDLAIQESGDASALYDLAMINGIGITDDVADGTELIMAGVKNERILQFGLLRKVKPITRVPKDDELIGEGIEFWGIEFDFKVF